MFSFSAVCPKISLLYRTSVFLFQYILGLFDLTVGIMLWVHLAFGIRSHLLCQTSYDLARMFFVISCMVWGVDTRFGLFMASWAASFAALSARSFPTKSTCPAIQVMLRHTFLWWSSWTVWLMLRSRFLWLSLLVFAVVALSALWQSVRRCVCWSCIGGILSEIHFRARSIACSSPW